MLPRAPLPETTDTKDMEEQLALHVHLIQLSLPVSKPKLEEIREETTKDELLKDLIEIIKRGWPETNACVSNSTCMFWDGRDELSELNGIILRGERILIPTSVPKEMLEKIHQGHMGIEKPKRRARDVLYWPGMGSEIQEKIARCSICQHQQQNAKEPMIPFQLPSKPWEKVATDLFTRDTSEYLIIVDYHSRFSEVAKLPDTKSNTVITTSNLLLRVMEYHVR